MRMMEKKWNYLKWKQEINRTLFDMIHLFVLTTNDFNFKCSYIDFHLALSRKSLKWYKSLQIANIYLAKEIIKYI